MPFKSKAQQRFLESKSSPLSASQKKEFEGATAFKALPESAKSFAKKVAKKIASRGAR